MSVIKLPLLFAGSKSEKNLLVVPALSEEAIIGSATLQKWRIKLDFEHDTVYVDLKVAKLQLI